MGKSKKASHSGIHSPLMACYHAVHQSKDGLPVIALLMEKNPDTLRKKLDKNKPSHVLTLDEAMHILRITGDTRILDSVCSQVGAVWFFPGDVRENPGDMDVLNTSTGLMNSAMALINTLKDALNNDGEVDNIERAVLDKKALQLQQAVAHFIETSKQFEPGDHS